jgi:(3,5-dihydroxyphenyl)acetyl-CoA 1,2-dioxygenase
MNGDLPFEVAMTNCNAPQSRTSILAAAGFSADAATEWNDAAPGATTTFSSDRHAYSDFWLKSARLIAQLPAGAHRNEPERTAATVIHETARRARTRFLQAHVEAVYDILTDRLSRRLRVEQLVTAAADVVPGLVPDLQDIAAEDGRLQRDRSGAEIDQGLFVSAVLANPRTGTHLCHAMLAPRPEAIGLARQFRRDGIVKLPGAQVRRHGLASIVTYANQRFLNAEDNIDAMEVCVDLALLDEDSQIVVLRGGPVEHPKYRGRRVFGAGINLTHLYHGRIPFIWYLQRDLGYVNKIYRGLTKADDSPTDEIGGGTIEKPWIAAVEGFAIGGHCQVLLVCDYVIAEDDAYLTLPARKEGIIPGAANLRLPRFTGDRLARRAIQLEERIACNSAEGRLICDETVAAGTMDEAIARMVSAWTGSGAVSAVGNRRALRIAQEPLDMFRSYMAVYAREQAYCHFSPALIRNLEQYWNAQNRKP